MAHPSSWSPAQVAAYDLRAEARAVEHGRHAIAVAPDRYRVKSATSDATYLVTVDRSYGGRILRLSCSCPSGTNRPELPVPCWHAALVARRLEREGVVEWTEGLWHYPDAPAPAPAPVGDPFAGLTEGDYLATL